MKIRKKKSFTLIELAVAMAVLAVFMMFLMRFFTSSQDVMKRTTDKTDQFERARIAMDLIAADIQNLSYTEGVNTLCYYQTADTNVTIPDIESGSGTTSVPVTTRLSLPVLRQDKPSDASSNLALVNYVYDSDALTLKTSIVWDTSASWRLNEISTAAGTLFPDPVPADLEEVIDGVLAFRVIPYSAGAGGSLSTLSPDSLVAAGSGVRRIPDMVRIEMTLVDRESMDAKHALENVEESVPDTLDPRNSDFANAARLRSFSRDIVLNRGQF